MIQAERKLHLKVGGVIIIAAVLIFAAIYVFSNQGKNQVQPIGIPDEAASILLKKTEHLAEKISLHCQKLSEISDILAIQSAYFLSRSDYFGNGSSVISAEKQSPEVRESVMTPDQITPDRASKIRSLSHIDHILKEIKNNHPECIVSFVATHFFAGRFCPETPQLFPLLVSKIELAADTSDLSHLKKEWTNFFQTADGRTAAATISPIICSDQFSGFAGIAVQMDTLIYQLSAHSDKPSDDVYFIFDNSGSVFIAPPDFNQNKGTNHEGDADRLAQLSNEILSSLKQGIFEQGSRTVRIVIHDIPYAAALQKIPATGFQAAVVTPETVLLQSAPEVKGAESQLPVVIAILLFVVFCVVGVSMFLFVRSNTPSVQASSHPESNKNIIVITDEMIDEEMNIISTPEQDNELTDFVDLIQEDETGTLAHSYNKMVEALQKINELEKKHSIDLAEANRQLQNEILERERAEQEIRLLSRRLINSIEEGRRELARDLHDEFGQTLAAMHLDAEALSKSIPKDMTDIKEKFDALIMLIEQLGDKIRNVSSELRPDLLDDLGLIPTLEWYIKELSFKRTEIHIDFHAVGFKKRLSSDIEIVLYRIFQECMNNIIKHAQAHHVEVMLTYNFPKVILMVKDDGIGFDTNQRAEGIGIAGMQERAVSANGQIEIRSAIGKGSTIRVELPVSKGTLTADSNTA